MQITKRILAQLFLLAAITIPLSTLSAEPEKQGWLPGDSYCLEGSTNFFIYSIGEEKVLFDGYLPCTAVLTITGKHAFELELTEYFPDSTTRVSTKYGKITPGGRVSFPYIGEVEALLVHVGLTVHGRGVVDGNTIYKGWFEGDSFYAYFEVLGHQTQAAQLPFYNKNPDNPEDLYEGPVSVYQDIELYAVDCPSD
jgi:hypothetical protein